MLSITYLSKIAKLTRDVPYLAFMIGLLSELLRKNDCNMSNVHGIKRPGSSCKQILIEIKALISYHDHYCLRYV